MVIDIESGLKRQRFDLNEQSRIHFNVHRIKHLEDKWNFYYDETNNIRKFKLQGTGFNASSALKKDFVLGGIAFDPIVCHPDVNVLFEMLDLNNIVELKFKNISKSDDFLATISTKKVFDFLSWLEDSGVYIHYSSLNNLYYSLVDIVDSAIQMNHGFEASIAYRADLKDSFYRFAKQHLQEITKIMISHQYPDISICDTTAFVADLLELIGSESNSDKLLKNLRYLLIYANKEEGMPFLTNNSAFSLSKVIECAIYLD